VNRRSISVFLFLIVLLNFSTLLSLSQDISKLGDNDLLNINGSISFDQMFLPNSLGDENDMRDPYSYYLMGGFNMSLYGIAIPFNFSYSNQNFGFSHPFNFNQFGAQPSYKWVKLYIGYNTMMLSPYTLNGHQFCGVGIEVNPPDFPLSGSIVYGRLLKATELEGKNSIPSYKRMGVGFKTNFHYSKINVSSSLFYAWDKEESIKPIPDSLGITPKENLTVSLDGDIVVFKGLSLDLSVGNSVLTDDKFSAISNENNFWAGLFPERTSTASYWAYKIGGNYGIQVGSVGLYYERIEPGFSTLGSYYFVNDLENITMNSSLRLIDGKLNVGGSFGIQKDNLNQQKLFSNRRFVGAGNISLTVSQNVSINSSISSFTSYTNMRSVFDNINSLSPYQNLDTLNFTQVNRAGNFSVNYGFGSETRKNTSTLSISGNKSFSEQGNSNTNDDVLFINAGVTHAITFNDYGLNISLSMFYSLNQNPLGNNNTLGPFINTSKSFSDGKIRLILGASYNRTMLGGNLQNSNANLRFSGSWNFKERNSLNFSAGYYKISYAMAGVNNKSDLVFNLMYSYNFQYKYSPSKGDD